MIRKLLKLRKMSPAEVGTRLNEACRKWQERWFARQSSYRRSSSKFRTDLVGLLPGSEPSEWFKLKSICPEAAQKIRTEAEQAANRIISGRWPLLGFPVDLTGEIDWHKDPRTDYRFPQSFYGDISLYELDPQVDVKFVWELGRQQYVTILAMAWRMSGKEEYAQAARRLLLGWIEHNPPLMGVHWTSGLELAMRGISWIWAVACLQDWSGWQPEDLQKIASSLAAQADYLSHHLSYYSSPYNHLIGEATGLVLIGSALEHRDSDKWRTLGGTVLQTHSVRQYSRDGFCVEQATGYHYYTLGFLVLAWRALEREKGNPAPSLPHVIEKAFAAGAPFQMTSGRWPGIGDVDSARSIPVPHSEFFDFNPLQDLGATLFEKPEWKTNSENPGAETFWLLGSPGAARWKDLPGPESQSNIRLEDAGYTICRGENDWLLFDTGEIAHGVHQDGTPSTAHGHLDMLQVLLCLDGQPILRDPGMLRYFGSRDWVDYFRSSAAHNTVEIKGTPQALFAGRLAWSNSQARPVLESCLTPRVSLLVGRTTYGFTRYLLFLPGTGTWIVDKIVSKTAREVIWNWQIPASLSRMNFAPGAFRCESFCWGMWSTMQKNSQLESSVLELAVQVEKGVEGSPSGWHAPGYGQRDPAARLSYQGRCPAGTTIVATYWGRAPLPARILLDGQIMECGAEQASTEFTGKAEIVFQGNDWFYAGGVEHGPYLSREPGVWPCRGGSR